MTHRHCSTCATEVEDTGGFCLLGHSLKLQPEVSADQLRAEVDKAFDEARAQVASVLSPIVPREPEAAPPVSPTPPGAPPPPPPAIEQPRRPAVWQALEVAPEESKGDPINAFAPPPSMNWGPSRSRMLRR